MSSVIDWLISILRTISQILMAGVAITAFSMLLYAITFNLRQQVARMFSLIMVLVVIIYTAESLGSTFTEPSAVSFWLKLQWAGILFIPPAYLQFSNAILATVGKPSKGKRLFAIIAAYLISFGFLVLLLSGNFTGVLVNDGLTLAHLKPLWPAHVFALYYLAAMISSGYNFVRSYHRTTTSSSRRRMGYLLIGSFGPAVGMLPFLLFGSGIIRTFSTIFWLLSALNYTLVLVLIVMMSYAVAFFGSGLPDRLIRNRLLEWLLRGPLTASFALGVITIAHRFGIIFGNPYPAYVPILMVVTTLLLQFFISLGIPYLERQIFWRTDREELQTLRKLETGFLTKNDLHQFLEMLLSATADQLQANGGFIAAKSGEKLAILQDFGRHADLSLEDELAAAIPDPQNLAEDFYIKDENLYIPLAHISGTHEHLGLLGLYQVIDYPLPEDEQKTFDVLIDRLSLALKESHLQEDISSKVEAFSNDAEVIGRLRAAGRFGSSKVLSDPLPTVPPDLIQSVRDALLHYWGGPKLTNSPLIKLRVVQQEIEVNEGNYTHAIRSILKQAVEKTRPEGERHYTTDWILYNILDLKFLEGKKVRDIAQRLAISEADLYRKQRIAIEAVAREIQEMENQFE